MSESITATIDDWLESIADTRSEQTHKTYAYGLRVFQTWLADQLRVTTIDHLDMPLLKAYVNALLRRQLADRTRQHYVDVVCRWIGSLVENGELTGVRNERGRLVSPAGVRDQLERMLPRREPAVAPRMPDLRRLPAYYAEQRDQFLGERSGTVPGDSESVPLRNYLNLLRNQALIDTLFSSGGRVNEILAIDVTHVTKRGRIADAIQIQGKGRKKRAIYLNAETRESIHAYLSARRSIFSGVVPLFISHGPRARGERLSDVSAWRIVKQAAEALADLRMTEGADDDELDALREVSPHSLRHFFAQSMLDEGADYKDIAGALGHSSTNVTEQVYARQSPEEILEVVATFAARPSRGFRQRQADEPQNDEA